MKKYVILTAIITFLSIQDCVSQNRSRQDIALDKLEALKTGYLFVRIEDYANDIDALKQKKMIAWANKLKEKASAQAESIINGFADQYTFSNFLFYNAVDASKLIIDRNYGVLYDQNNDKATLDELKHIFIAIYDGKFHIYELTEVGLIDPPDLFPSTSDQTNFFKRFLDVFRRMDISDKVASLDEVLRNRYNKLNENQ